MEQIKRLAREMGVTESDLIGFVMMLRHHMDKGMTMDTALSLISENAKTLLQAAYLMAQDKDFRSHIADEVWETINGGVA